CMTGLSSLIIYKAWQLAKWADIASSLSFEALRGIVTSLDKRIQNIKSHSGQKIVASNMRKLLNNSKLIQQPDIYRVQDALSLRSIPQVHGAFRDELKRTKEVVQNEINSANDNPLVFSSDKTVISSANPHGQSVAL